MSNGKVLNGREEAIQQIDAIHGSNTPHHRPEVKIAHVWIAQVVSVQ